MYQRLLQLFIVGLYGIPFIPFVRSVEYVFPEVTLKTFVFQACVEVLAALWLFLMLARVLRPPRLTPVLVSGAVLFGVLSVSAALGVTPARSFWGTQERAVGIVLLAHCAVLALMLRSAREHIVWERYLGTSVASATAMTMVAIVQHYVPDLFYGQDGSRPGAFLGNPSFLAAYLLFHLYFALWLATRLFRTGKVAWAKLVAAAALPMFVTIFFTQTRGAILGLAVSVVVLAVWAAAKGGSITVRGRLTLRHVGATLLLALVLVVGTFALTRSAAVWQHVPGLARLTHVSLESREVRGRIAPLRIVYKAFPERPLLGFGYESFRYVFDVHYEASVQEFDESVDTYVDKPHNILGEHLVTTGALGLAAYLTFLSLLGMALARSKRPDFAPFGLAALAAYFVQNLVLFDTLGPLLALALLVGCAEPDDGASVTSPVRDARSRFVLAAAALATLLGAVGLAANVSVLRANRGQRWSIEHMFAGRLPDRAYASHAQAVAAWANPYLDEARQAFVTNLAAAQAQGVPIAPELVQRGLADLRITLRTDPTNYLARVTYAHALTVFYPADATRMTEGLRVLEEAVLISPGRTRAYGVLGTVFLLQGRTDMALKAAQKMVELHPRVGDTHFYHAMIAFEAKQSALGLKSLDAAAQRGRVPRTGQEMRVVADNYAELKNYPMAVKFYEQAVKADPSDVSASWKLGIVYYYAGNKDAARVQLARVATIKGIRTAMPYDDIKHVFESVGVAVP